MRALGIFAVLVLLASACSSSGAEKADREARGTGSLAETGSTGTLGETATEAESAGERAEPTTAGAWLARYSLWVTDLRVALENAGTVRHVRGRPAPLTRLVSPKRREHDDALAELRGCRETLAGLGEPPTPRLARVARRLRAACSAFARGATLAAAGAQYQRSFELWSRATDLVRRANARLARPVLVERLPVAVGGGDSDETRIEPFFTEIANEVAAPAAQVRCWAEPEWTSVKKQLFGRNLDIAGYADHDTKRTGLSLETCRWLGVLAYTRERPAGVDQLRIAVAVNALMHESGHLNETGDFYGAGRNEPLAECWAMQHIRAAARRLGADGAYASTLAERYWAEVYPNQRADYRSKQCRDGGAFDLRPAGTVWP